MLPECNLAARHPIPEIRFQILDFRDKACPISVSWLPSRVWTSIFCISFFRDQNSEPGLASRVRTSISYFRLKIKLFGALGALGVLGALGALGAVTCTTGLHGRMTALF